MQQRNFLVILLLSAMVCKMSAAQTVTPLTINKNPIPNTTTASYYTSMPFMLHISGEKNIMLALVFTADQKNGDLTGIKGFDLFAKGLGNCFFQDSLQFVFENGQTLNLGTSNPKLCDQPISGWIMFGKKDIDTIFAANIRQVTYKNGLAKESTTLDITDPHDKSFFVDVKRVFNTMVPKKEGTN